MNATLTAIATLKTVILEFTTAPIIRSVARRDIPEYGLTEGQVFYMARSSENNGKYYILTWDYTAIRWNCSCPATTNNCRHHRLVKADCAKQHSLQGYKPVSKADTFAALMQKYDIRSQAQAQAVATTRHAEIMTAEDLDACVRQDLAYTFGGDSVLVEAFMVQEQARRATAEREACLRAQAPLNGSRAFSFMR